jgi:hypothetical protein
MKTVILVAAILALSVPSYGAVLVYKLAQTDNPIIDFANVNENSADLFKGKVEAYIVFDANLTGDYGVNVGADANDANDVTVVLLFKSDKQYMLLGGSDPNSDVSIDNYPSSNSIRPFIALNKQDNENTLLFIDINDEESGVEVQAFDLFGKNTSTDIGLANKTLLAKSLKGFSEITIDEAGDLYGFGSAKLTLDSKYTKLAGKNGLTVPQTVAAITGDLKNFTETQTVPRD